MDYSVIQFCALMVFGAAIGGIIIVSYKWRTEMDRIKHRPKPKTSEVIDESISTGTDTGEDVSQKDTVGRS